MVGAEILGCTLAMLGEQALSLRVKHLLVHVALLRDILGKISRLPVLINELLLLILMDIQDRLRSKDIRLLTPVLAKLRLWREVA
jgi:hypothetical protein